MAVPVNLRDNDGDPEDVVPLKIRSFTNRQRSSLGTNDWCDNRRFHPSIISGRNESAVEINRWYRQHSHSLSDLDQR